MSQSRPFLSCQRVLSHRDSNACWFIVWQHILVRVCQLLNGHAHVTIPVCRPAGQVSFSASFTCITSHQGTAARPLMSTRRATYSRCRRLISGVLYKRHSSSVRFTLYTICSRGSAEFACWCDNSTQLNSSLFKSCSRKTKKIQCSAMDNQF